MPISRALLLFTLLWMLLGAVQAQDAGQPNDPAGRAHALELLKIFQENQSDPTNSSFLELFQENPNYTKRAFVSMIDAMPDEYETAPGKARVHLEFALVLAQLISETFADPEPLEILRGLNERDQAVSLLITGYLSRLLEADPESGSAVTSTPKPTEPSSGKEDPHPAPDIRDQATEAIESHLMKILRIQLAVSAANPDLIVSELDSYPASVAALQMTVRKLGFPDDGVNDLLRIDSSRFYESQKLTMLGEIGLLDEFEEKYQALIREGVDPLTEAALSLAGFRASYRQKRVEKSEKYLSRARLLLSDVATPTDPVLEYAVRTSEYQLRLLKGFEPDARQVAQSFQKAWSALDTYHPMKVVRHERNWYLGRLATRFWLEELAPHASSVEDQLDVLALRLVAWAEVLFRVNTSKEDYFHGDVEENLDTIFGYLNFSLSLIDQMIYVLEIFPEAIGDAGMAEEIVSVLEPHVTQYSDIPEAIGVNVSGPGFPHYVLTSGGLLPELIARFRYLEAIAGKGSPSVKSAKLTEAIGLIKKARNSDATVDYLIKIGREFTKLQQFDSAVSAWREAYSLATELQFVHRSVEASTLLAEEYGRRGDWRSAAFFADGATEKIHHSLPLLGLRSSQGKEMAARSEHLTDLSVRAHIESANPEKALASLTRNQQVQSAAMQMEGQQEAQKDAQQILKGEDQVTALGQEVERLQTMPESVTRNELLTKTQGLLASTRSEFLLQSRGLRQKYSDLYSSVLKFDPLNLPDIQKALPDDLAVIQYFATQDALYIFLVTKDTFRLHSVPVSDKDLNISVSAFRRAVAKRVNGDTKLAQNSRQLYQWLFQPLVEDIQEKSTLILIPSGRLHGLPFASLTDSQGQPLIASRRILELAKPTDLMRVSSEKVVPVSSVVAFANATEDLPAAAIEGEQIAALFPQSKLFEGKEATRENFFKYGGKAEVLHLATHGELNLDDSLKNYLALAGNQQVAQEEIFSLGLEETSIVILSACNTAMGEGTEAKYVASLAEAFWIAGSRSVVASLWDVNDESTALLMTEFYAKLREGVGKAVALQAAQMAVRSREEYAHPYYWAGFLLFGDWR